ncbi:hypothetical protein DPMN_157273 [Dreissena polymorpha]|uniref:Uncharacterized protein n=1 Tax=Dreissena polymorpha TaxID=45954 RepID=A0A9D4EH16_DREPO|nr:hypothetical protein DPMN_157273 [Dreissena polymorpha]
MIPRCTSLSASRLDSPTSSMSISPWATISPMMSLIPLRPDSLASSADLQTHTSQS